jgi:peptide/nickel transport system ATP-binding protein
MSILEVRDLTVAFRQRGGELLTAVNDVSFAIKAGQTLALVGESGSGKSTIVRTLAKLQRPTAGEILLDGAHPGRHGRELRAYRKRVQLIFQDPFASLNPMHTVRHHIARPLRRLHGGIPQQGLDGEIHALLRSVNLTPPEEVAGKHPHELSGGQRQRVAIARALASGPDVLLADEPVSMLDVSIRLEILNLLDRLMRERSLGLLYVTHDLATARHFATEIMVMYRGTIVERGPSDEVILRPAHPYTRLLASAAPDPARTRSEVTAARQARLAGRAARAVPAVPAVPQPRAHPVEPSAHPAESREAALASEQCVFIARCPHATEACRRRPPDVAAGAGHRVLCWLHAQSPVP